MTVADNSFCAELVARARSAKKRIVLPEWEEARVAEAAKRANKEGIAECVAVPADAAERFLPAFMSSRAARGMSEAAARAALSSSPVAAAAAMVKAGEAEGMVAGAVHASADVLRPALRIVGAGEGGFVSSLFFMCFAEGAKVFADCALNISPSPQQLAEIARQSAASARQFGIAPFVAFLSYATGESAGETPEVRKIKSALETLREKEPNLPATGPVQYDAATDPETAARKAPGDPAAGRATVLIFPDLSCGNITYKAVQRAANIVAIGPLLQGLAAPVNDLSRGATPKDIYYTIAATAAQAQN